MSGEGVNGGWLKVRGALRYRRISAGIKDSDPELHLGQDIDTPQKEVDLWKTRLYSDLFPKSNKNCAENKTIGYFTKLGCPRSPNRRFPSSLRRPRGRQVMKVSVGFFLAQLE